MYAHITTLKDNNLLQFAELLGSMRNYFAHDIRHISTGIRGYFDAIKNNTDEYGKWLKIFDLIDYPLKYLTKPPIPRHDFIKFTARHAIDTFTIKILRRIDLKKSEIKIEKLYRSAAMNRLKEDMSKLKGR